MLLSGVGTNAIGYDLAPSVSFFFVFLFPWSSLCFALTLIQNSMLA
ncbi:unnamed protein product [Spirodela intermedia]|uniref:Uncharacterized protein n=1 Tax=Spirodela intermedia TaxID=51605 RepID=A0A7I8JMI5_SPIIN|nr:unnamed protein product [Spirodela intermedia]CAA6671339.1 unnamed protein product [Spirodela intermedia]